MAAIFDRHRSSVEDYVHEFKHQESQTGALFAIGKEVVGFDLFDRATTLAGMLPKLVRSYAIDAIESASRNEERPNLEVAQAFVERVAGAQVVPVQNALSTSLRLLASAWQGGYSA